MIQFLVFVALCRTHSSKFIFLLYWGTQNWSQNFRCSLTSSEKRKDHLPWTCWQGSIEAQPSLHAATLLLLVQSQMLAEEEFCGEKLVSEPTTVSVAERLYVEDKRGRTLRTHKVGKEHYFRVITKERHMKNLSSCTVMKFCGSFL